MNTTGLEDIDLAIVEINSTTFESDTGIYLLLLLSIYYYIFKSDNGDYIIYFLITM
jgi:hypothetical protein